MQPVTTSEHRSTAKWADASLFHAVAMEAARRHPSAISGFSFERFAPHFPTRTGLVPTRLLHDLRQACIDSVGPAATFNIYANCLLGRSYPFSMPLVTAPNAASLVRRIQAVEELTPRISTTTLIDDGDRWVELQQRRHDAAMAGTVNYSIAYWGMIVGLFAAAGYRDLVLVSQDTIDSQTICVNGTLREGALTALPSMQLARLAWRARDPITPTVDAIATVTESPMIGHFALAISSAIESGSPLPSLETLALLAHRSARSVQRDLTSIWTTLRDIRMSVRMQRVTLLLAESSQTLAEVAFNSGFSDAPHLAREFKRVVGLTPERYRMMCRM